MAKVALITGVGRKNSIAYTLAAQLARDGWDLVLNYWHAYDDRLALGYGGSDLEDLKKECELLGSRVKLVAADLEELQTPQLLVDYAQEFGGLNALVLSHCESTDSDILTTTVESWDRHYHVNVRASWLLVQAFARSANSDPQDIKSVVALTSDHTAFNLPYGSSKGALDRLIIAAGVELGMRGFRANLINPGPINTGWMDDATEESLAAQTPTGRLGVPQDTAHLVSFLLSEQGSWINAQLLFSNGGFGAKA